jgi:hypothetical protein
MASEERKKADEAIKQQNLHDALGAEEQQAETDAFQCSKCKQVRLVSSVYYHSILITTAAKMPLPPGSNQKR